MKESGPGLWQNIHDRPILKNILTKSTHMSMLSGGGHMKLSTRNQIKGKVIEVVKGKVAAKVKVDIGGGNVISSTITVDAVNDLKLKKGDAVVVLIKASSVMIGK